MQAPTIPLKLRWLHVVVAAFMFTSGAPLLHAAHETDGEPGGRLAGVSSGEMSSVNCPANTVIPNGSLASVVGTSFSGSVYIQGLFVVDDDVSFWGAHVYMEAGAQLIVEPNIWLTIIGSTFIACDTAMWKGITVHDGATISISNTSVMEDAEHLVRALDGATVVFMDSQFHNNRVSLYIPPAPGNTWNSVSVYAVNNMFYSQGPMCGPYPGQATTVGQVGFAAVEAHRTYLDLSNGYNLIHTMSNGIVAFNSNVKVEGCEIYIIQPDAAYALPANGSGIYANGMNGYYYLDQKGNGMAGPPNFRNCRWGIYTEYMNVDSRDNHMMSLFGGAGMGTGYHIRRSGSRTVKVYDNSVKALYSGMELWANDGAAQMLVTGNSISFGEDVCPPLTTCTNSYAGIDVAEGNTFNQNSSIVNNSVGHTAEKMSHTGIRLQAADYWLVADNTVVLVNNPNNHNGILTTGCRYGQVSCNTIAGPGGDYSNPRQAAIRNAMGSDPMFVCNNVDRTTHGFLFGGAAYGTDLRGNHIRRHKHGLYLDNTAIIGTQTLKGNLWYNPPQTLGGWGAYYVNALNAGSNPFYINPAMIGMGNTQPPSWWPGNWFQPMAGTNFQCSGTEDYCDVFNGMGGEGGMEQLDLLIAGDSLAGTPYLEETRWIMRGDLLRKLDARPALMDGQPGLLEFHAAMQGSTQAAFNQLDIVRSGMFELEDEVLAQLAANHEQAVALAVLVQQALGQLADSTLAVEQRAAILADLAGHQQQMATLAEADAAMLANAATARETIATEVDALNNGIAAAATIEANHQQVNTIRTATIGRDVDMFTPEQIAALYAIASQCPLAGGNAVYQARSLHALAVGAQVFDDEALCAAPEGGGKRLAATRAMNGVALMPNPAHAEVTLVLDKEYRAVLYVTVYDMVGHVALRATVPPGTTRHALDTSGLTPGAYSYHVQAPDVRPVGEGKLFIAR